MARKYIGSVSLMFKSKPFLVMIYYCISYQEYVIENVVSIFTVISSKGLNHRQFQAFLAEVGSDYALIANMILSTTYS